MATVIGTVEAILALDARQFQAGLRSARSEWEKAKAAADEAGRGATHFTQATTRTLPALRSAQALLSSTGVAGTQLGRGLDIASDSALLLRNSLGGMGTPIGIAIAGITALIVVLHKLRQAEKQAREEREKHLKSIRDLAEATEFATEAAAKRSKQIIAQELPAFQALRKEQERQLGAAKKARDTLPQPGRTTAGGLDLEALGKLNAARADVTRLEQALTSTNNVITTLEGTSVAAGRALVDFAEEAKKAAAAVEKQIAAFRLDVAEQEALAAAMGKSKTEQQLLALEFDRGRMKMAISADATAKQRREIEGLIDKLISAKRAQIDWSRAQEEARRLRPRVTGEDLGALQLRSGGPLVREARAIFGKQIEESRRLLQENARIAEQAADDVEAAFASGFDAIFRDGLQGFDDFAEQLANLFARTAADIAANFVAELVDVEGMITTLRSGGKLSAGKGGAAGALIGGAAGFQSGSPLTGAIAGGVSGFALGGPVAGILGAVGGLVGGLLGQAQQAKEAARQMEQARREWKRALDAWADSFADLSEFERAREDALRKFEELAEPIAGRDIAGAITPEKARQHLDYLERLGLGATRQAQALRELLDVYEANIEVIERQMAIARQSFEQQLELRMLVARGQTEQAQALRDLIELEDLLKRARELGVDEATVRAVLEEEKLARARAKAAEAAAEAARKFSEMVAFDVDVGVREARLRGDDRGALEGELRERGRREIENAKKLLDAGTITIDVFERLVAVIEGEVIEAMKDFDDALEESRRAIDFDLNSRLLLAKGDRTGAFDAQQAEEARKAREALEQGKITQAQFDKLVNEVQPAERAAFLSGLTEAVAGAISEATGARDVVRGVQAITATQAINLVDLQRSANILLGGIEFNTRALRGDGVGVFPGLAAGGFRGGPTLQISVTVNGHIFAVDSQSAGRLIARGAAGEINRIIGEDSETSGVTTGIPLIR